MKKKLLFGFVFAAMVIGISGLPLTKSKVAKISASQMENIEALSNSEQTTYYDVYHIEYPWGWGCNCTGTGNKECC